MRKHLMYIVYIGICLFSAGMMACSPSNQPNGVDSAQTLSEEEHAERAAELDQFLSQVNDRNKQIPDPETDYRSYLPLNLGSEAQLENKVVKNRPEEKGVLSLEQVENDFNILLYHLQSDYGHYNYFGGNEKFFEAREKVLEDCAELDKITVTDFERILLESLSFVEDKHFIINGKSPVPSLYPYRYEEIMFEKTEDGYRALDTGLMVGQVQGQEDLDTLFRPSISEEGAIVYYPIILSDEVPGDLTITYADGTEQSISPTPYRKLEYRFRNKVLGFSVKDEIPVISINQMPYDETAVDQLGKDFLAYGEEMRDRPIAIVDLRANIGGNGALPIKWLNAYTGQKVGTHAFRVIPFETVESGNPGSIGYQSLDTKMNVLGWRTVDRNCSVGYVEDAEFVNNDRLLIVLTSKLTASSAEIFVDAARSIQNVLVIGENTNGAMRGDAGASIKLFNSGLPVIYGKSLLAFAEEESTFPEKEPYFQEGRGLLPDLWTSAGQAEELALKLIRYYGYH